MKDTTFNHALSTRITYEEARTAHKKALEDVIVEFCADFMQALQQAQGKPVADIAKELASHIEPLLEVTCAEKCMLDNPNGGDALANCLRNNCDPQ